MCNLKHWRFKKKQENHRSKGEVRPSFHYHACGFSVITRRRRRHPRTCEGKFNYIYKLQGPAISKMKKQIPCKDAFCLVKICLKLLSHNSTVFAFFWLNQFFFGNPTVFDGFRRKVVPLICRKIQFLLRQVFAPGLSHSTHILHICDQNKISKNMNGKLCVLQI